MAERPWDLCPDRHCRLSSRGVRSSTFCVLMDETGLVGLSVLAVQWNPTLLVPSGVPHTRHGKETTMCDLDSHQRTTCLLWRISLCSADLQNYVSANASLEAIFDVSLSAWPCVQVALCKHNTSNDMFSMCKSVQKMATGKSDDQNFSA